ncbi:MAG: S8 family peptidase [Eubacteriales bacterium]|nr:S8 family peptidase [Eubacteriales bacterium]
MSTSAKIPAQIFHATPFHQKGITGKHITVAIIDSGVSYHPDLPANRILACIDFTQSHSVSQCTDAFSHGTHVAGIIASRRIGIAPECNIISLKILDQYGRGKTEHFIDAVKWILRHKEQYHIQIANISIGGNTSYDTSTDSLLNYWVQQLWDHGIVVCCSAGNNGPRPGSITAPGSCRKVITVGSSDGTHYSSAGPLLPRITKPELIAPGTQIISLKPNNGYTLKSGTSMATPFVSGACALLLQHHPELTNDQIKIRLMESAHPVSYLPTNMQGAGLLSLKDLLS